MDTVKWAELIVGFHSVAISQEKKNSPNDLRQLIQRLYHNVFYRMLTMFKKNYLVVNSQVISSVESTMTQGSHRFGSKVDIGARKR